MREVGKQREGMGKAVGLLSLDGSGITHYIFSIDCLCFIFVWLLSLLFSFSNVSQLMEDWSSSDTPSSGNFDELNLIICR